MPKFGDSFVAFFPELNCYSGSRREELKGIALIKNMNMFGKKFKTVTMFNDVKNQQKNIRKKGSLNVLRARKNESRGV